MKAALALALLAIGASAAPLDSASLEVTPREPIGPPPCINFQKYHVKDVTVAPSAPKLATGFRCKSLTDASCTLTHGNTFSRSETHTVSVGFTGTLNIGMVASAAADAGYSESWSTTKASDTSAGVTCPAGGFDCGLQVITSLVTTTGTVVVGHTGTCDGNGQSTYNYKVVAPRTVPGAPANQAAVMTFHACLASCSGDLCTKGKAMGLDMCPKE